MTKPSALQVGGKKAKGRTNKATKTHKRKSMSKKMRHTKKHHKGGSVYKPFQTDLKTALKLKEFLEATEMDRDARAIHTILLSLKNLKFYEKNSNKGYFRDQDLSASNKTAIATDTAFQQQYTTTGKYLIGDELKKINIKNSEDLNDMKVTITPQEPFELVTAINLIRNKDNNDEKKKAVLNAIHDHIVGAKWLGSNKSPYKDSVTLPGEVQKYLDQRNSENPIAKLDDNEKAIFENFLKKKIGVFKFTIKDYAKEANKYAYEIQSSDKSKGVKFKIVNKDVRLGNVNSDTQGTLIKNLVNEKKTESKESNGPKNIMNISAPTKVQKSIWFGKNK